MSDIFDKAFEKKFGKTEKQLAQDKVLSELGDLFGFDAGVEPDTPAQKSAVLPENNFDEGLFSKTKPVFERALEAFGTSDDVSEAMSNLLDKLGEKVPAAKIQEMKPYIVRFMEERFPAAQQSLPENQNESINKSEEQNNGESSGKNESDLSVPESQTDTGSKLSSADEGSSAESGSIVRGPGGVGAVESDQSGENGADRTTAKSDEELSSGLGQRTIDAGGESAPIGNRSGTELRDSAKNIGNFSITDELDIEKFSPKEMYRKNADAIRLLKTLESENRQANSEEQKTSC